MTEIAAGIKEISSSVGGVLESATRLGAIGEGLNEELSRFRTEAASGG
jgi:hypothetical protein